MCTNDGPWIWPFIDHIPGQRCPTVFATVYEDEEEHMPRRDGMDLDDLSHEMARVLRKQKCRHHFEGYVEMGQLARYLRVPYNDVAAVVGAKHCHL